MKPEQKIDPETQWKIDLVDITNQLSLRVIASLVYSEASEAEGDLEKRDEWLEMAIEYDTYLSEYEAELRRLSK